MLIAVMAFTGIVIPSKIKKIEVANNCSISPKSSTYKGKYKKSVLYNSATKNYFVIRSYLEKLEKSSGGKLVLKKGTYKVSNVLYVPSNVTIELKDGVIIKKTMKTKNKGMKSSGGIFELLEPSKAKKKGVHGKYNGVHDVKIYSTGNAVIDQAYQGNNKQNCIGLVMCHNNNISIEGITFRNMDILSKWMHQIM